MPKPDIIQAFAAVASVVMSLFALIYSRRAIKIGRKAASSEMKADALALFDEGLKRLTDAKFVLEDQISKEPHDRDYELISNARSILKDFKEGDLDDLRKETDKNELYLALATLHDDYDGEDNTEFDDPYLKRALHRPELHEKIDFIIQNDIQRANRAMVKLDAARGQTVGQFMAELFKRVQ